MLVKPPPPCQAKMKGPRPWLGVRWQGGGRGRGLGYCDDIPFRNVRSLAGAPPPAMRRCQPSLSSYNVQRIGAFFLMQMGTAVSVWPRL